MVIPITARKKLKERDEDDKVMFEDMLETLDPKLQALKTLDGKKYKRFAKGVEAFMRGAVNNPGAILTLVAASVQMPDNDRLGTMLDYKVGKVGHKQWITLSKIRQELLSLWRQLGYISQEEIDKREEGE